MVSALQGEVKGWPVKLGKYPPSPDDASEAEAKPKKKGGNNKTLGKLPFWHKEMNKADAETKLAEMGNIDGNFLLRGPTNKRVLSVVYKGKPTHHLIATDDDGFFTVNKKKYGESKSVQEVIKLLQSH